MLLKQETMHPVEVRIFLVLLPSYFLRLLKKSFTYILLLPLFLTGLLPVSAQLSRPGLPLPIHYEGAPELTVYNLLIAEEKRAALFSSGERSMLKSGRAGLTINVSIDPENAGTWDTLADGTRLWRVGFRVEDAAMLSVIFSPWQVQQGVKVFLFDAGQQQVHGAFTDLNNKPFSRLGSAQINGNLIIVEMQVPAYLSFYGDMGISGIGCGFLQNDSFKFYKDGWFGKSGNCNVDVNCISDTLVQLRKHAVVRVIYDGTERCTGTLVNNTRQNGINYLLTAEHCINTEDIANTAVFYFDYESPFCNGPDGNNLMSISGATLRATGGDLDFSLLELLEPVPFSYHPYYAGWNALGYIPESGFTIHHPYGDVKKISLENDALEAASFGEDYIDDSHWRVSRWDAGTTEVGSSGAPFFDQYGLIVGTLTGGQANCISPVNDYYQMFSKCWDFHDNPDLQLAYWLDPLGKQKGFLEGYDPYAGFWQSGDTLFNIAADELLTTENATLLWGSYAGHNNLYTTAFAEKFSQSASLGLPGMLLHINNCYVNNAAATISVKIWEGGDLPGKALYQQEVYMSALSAQTLQLIEFDSVVTVPPGFFAGYEISYANPPDTFSTFMAANRTTDPLQHTAYVYQGSQWQSLAAFTGQAIHSSFAVYPVVMTLPTDTSSHDDDAESIIVYPNPARSAITLQFREMTGFPVTVTLYNLQGQQVLRRHYGPFQHIIPLDISLAGGVYLIRVDEGPHVHRLKLSVIK
ncbi:MAG: T9SS type A sorting domain-containing protein [Bacteroidales bacterium]|nr:T9SS type A sorting domain-containing protein [Bacteroidales bacterium]